MSGGITENKMGTMPMARLILTMSVPMMISMLVQALYNVVDSIFVAQIDEVALAAVTLAFPVQNLMIAVGVGTGVGINALLSRQLGEKNPEGASRTACIGVALAVMSSAVFTLFGLFGTRAFFRTQTSDPLLISYGTDYLSIVCSLCLAMFTEVTMVRLLTSTGRTNLSMISQISGAVTNIILDPIMIFGYFGFPQLGVSGAALATVIGQAVGAVVSIFLNIRRNREITLKPSYLRFDAYTVRRIYAVGLPSILMGSIGSVMTYLLDRILIAFSSTAVAVFGAYFKLQSFFFMPVFGLNNGMVPIVAYNYGAKNRQRIVHAVRISCLYAVCSMTAGLLVLELLPGTLLSLFNATPEMLAMGTTALRIIGSHFPLAAFSVVFMSVLQALGSGVSSLIVSVARQLGALLPVAWLLSLSGDVGLIWWAFPIAELVSLSLCILMIRRVYRDKVAGLAPDTMQHADHQEFETVEFSVLEQPEE